MDIKFFYRTAKKVAIWRTRDNQRQQFNLDDLIQEAVICMVKLFNNGKINKKTHKNVLTMIAVNAIRDYNRDYIIKGERNRNIMIGMTKETTHHPNLEPTTELSRIIFTSNPKHQCWINLRFSGFKYKEIAEMYNVTGDGVGVAVRRAIKKYTEGKRNEPPNTTK